MFDGFDVLHVFFRQTKFFVAEPLDGELLEGLDAEVCMFLEQCDALADTLYAVFVELRLWRRDGIQHVLHICVEEHGSVNDAVPRNVVEGVTADLPAVDEHIVVLR